MEQSNPTNPGKMMSLAGVITGIIASIGGIGIFLICAGWTAFEGGMGAAIGLAIGWTFLALVGLYLSIKGRKKSKEAGRKKGLGTFGIICGIGAMAACGIIFTGIYIVNKDRLACIELDKKAAKQDSASKDDAQRLYDSMMNSMNGGGDTAGNK